jgi:iron complex outermembrane receptor protein
MKRSLLTLALLAACNASSADLALAAPAEAPREGSANGETTVDANATNGADSKPAGKKLEAVVVTAVPGGQGVDELVTPVSVLAGDALDDAKRGTIGQTVAGIPGVQTTSFGDGVGRPVIRGLDGPRVAILSSGVGSGDVSSVSQDHAVTVEPFLADQIEILKGPSTLLYGSGAIGGVVNVVDGRIATMPLDAPFAGRVEASHDSVSDGDTQMFRVDGGNDRFALHADGIERDNGDYDSADGRVLNSFVHTRAGAVGGSWFIGDGYVGLAVSRYLNAYGNPAENGADGDAAVRLDMAQTRYDLKSGWNAPFAGVDNIELTVAHGDYVHTEFEGDEVGTVFTNDSNEARVVLTHSPLAEWKGAVGAQFFDRDFAAIGEESFVPATMSRGVGLFITEQREFDRLKVELGARADKQHSDPVNDARRDFDPFSLSAGLSWRIDDAWHISANLDRAQRAPAEEELFANGPHVASATFEIGDPTLEVETANQIELGLHHHGERIEASIAAYTNRYDDFIYLADTGEIEDDLPVRQWSQANATFHGAEIEAILHAYDGVSGKLDMRVWGDTVRAKLDDGGGDLPRIPASRVGAQLTWANGPWRASLGATRYAEQDRVAEFETPTDGFTLVDAHVAWNFHDGERSQWQAFVNARNLTDQRALLATSLIKDDAPMPGRNVQVGLRGTF